MAASFQSTCGPNKRTASAVCTSTSRPHLSHSARRTRREISDKRRCEIEPADVVAIWGCGPVGQFCIKSALMLGAARVIAIDHVPERLALARLAGAETIDFDEIDRTVLEKLKDMTGGNGPDKCIDAVGAESHATASFDAVIDKAKAAVMLGTDRPHALRAAIIACRPGGIVSVPGIYGGLPRQDPEPR